MIFCVRKSLKSSVVLLCCFCRRARRFPWWCWCVNDSYKLWSLSGVNVLRLWRGAVCSWVRCDMSLEPSGVLSASCLAQLPAQCSTFSRSDSNFFFSVRVICIYTKLRSCSASCCIQLVCPSFGKLRASHWWCVSRGSGKFALPGVLEQRKLRMHLKETDTVLPIQMCCSVLRAVR